MKGKTDQQDGDEENRDLESIENQGLQRGPSQHIISTQPRECRGSYHVVLANDPPEHDNQGEDQERNLHAGSNRHADREVHLVLHGHRDRRRVLGRIAHDGKEDQTNERLRNTTAHRDGVDGANQELGTSGHQGRGCEEREDGHPDVQLGFVLLLLRLGVCGLMGILTTHARERFSDGRQIPAGISFLLVAALALLGLLAGRVVDLDVRFQLKKQITPVDSQEDDTSA
jgi:hypothetical protein